MLTRDQIEFLEDKAKTLKWHKDSFNCSKCPKEGCPAWWKFKWNLYNAELKAHSEKTIEGCKFVLEPIFMADSQMTTYSMVDATGNIVKGFKESTQKLDEHTTEIKKGFVGLLRLIGMKDIQRILVENEELRKKLEEKNITLLSDSNEG